MLRRRPIITHSALALLLALAAGHGVNRAFGCGPDFPNNLLQGGDAPLLAAPVGDFQGELLRRNLAPTRLKAVPAEAGNAAQAADADVADLEAALKKSKSSKADFNRIRSAYQTNRARLRRFVEDLEQWKDSGLWVYDEEGSHREAPTAPPPVLPQLENPEGLPPEFSDYLEGAVAWHNPAVTDKSAARHAWERLLGRPADERPFKSTWAAFMLGRSWEKEDPQKAAQYYRQVRELAAARFADRAGLAAASLGLEARVALAEKHYEHALELYLEQFAAGDPTAANSLTWVAQQVLGSAASSEELEPLARNPRTREILTAYLVSRTWEDYSTSLAWLEAVETAGVRDAASAEKLALAAYQANEIDLAERWIKRAPSSPLTQWLQAKLFLRAGKTDQAAALLSRVSRSFPILPPPSADNPPPPTLQANLRMNETDFLYGRVTASRQVLGELGAFRLARRDYAQALDALLRAGFWMDAAYVAERVLSLDELKTYVDQFWPPVSAQTAADEAAEYGKSAISPAVLREKIRYLLARRLVRNIRGDEARDYYPDLWVGSFDLLAANLRSGWDESLPPDERARGLFAAAIITRTNGLELLGTEVQPDWAIHDGNFEEGVTWEDRSTNTVESFVHASPDEIHRASSHNADPETRWHYRWQAASLAWTAAGLMPNDSDDTALVLCRGGTWLKGVDPECADYFYKALVRRNRHTALGAEADRMRWFPRLDANGQWLPHVEPEPEPVMEAASDSMADPNLEIESPEPPEADTEAASPLTGTPEENPPGYYYIIHKGDSLAVVARAYANAGVAVTPAQIRAANPGLDEARLKVGQKLFIPSVETDR